MTYLIDNYSPYIAIFTLLICLIYPYDRLGKYHQDSIKWLCFLVFTLFFGLHGNVGDDYEAYRSLYDEVSVTDSWLLEPGFTLFIWCFKALHLPFWCFLLGCSLLINGLLFAFLWHRKENVPFVLCVFLAMSGIMLEINYLRNTISIMLFVNSIKFLQSKNIRNYMALNTIGILFHYSSVVYILLYFFLRHKYKINYVLITSLVGLVVGLLHLSILAPLAVLLNKFNSDILIQLSSYYLSTDLYLGFSLGTIERLLTMITVLCLYERFSTNVQGTIIVNSFLAYFLLYSFLSAYAMLGIRMSNMFVYSYWLLWPLIIEAIECKKIKIGVYLLMLIYMAVRINGLSNLPQWQYKTILFAN